MCSRGVRSQSSSSAVAVWPQSARVRCSPSIALSVHIEIEPDEAWDRVSGTGRPLARDPQAFRALYDERLTLYEAADASARDLDGVLLAAAGCPLRASR